MRRPLRGPSGGGKDAQRPAPSGAAKARAAEFKAIRRPQRRPSGRESAPAPPSRRNPPRLLCARQPACKGSHTTLMRTVEAPGCLSATACETLVSGALAARERKRRWCGGVDSVEAERAPRPAPQTHPVQRRRQEVPKNSTRLRRDEERGGEDGQRRQSLSLLHAHDSARGNARARQRGVCGAARRFCQAPAGPSTTRARKSFAGTQPARRQRRCSGAGREASASGLSAAHGGAEPGSRWAAAGARPQAW